MNEIGIGIYKEPGKPAIIISAFGHLLFICSFEPDFENARIGKIVVGTEEEIKSYVKKFMPNFVLDWVYIAPLYFLSNEP